ncbi:MAG TPA: translation elongation factor 4 [Candidatus Paceibacterota bacterium]|nr:translation elongation factor 4 [Candidatus Paceibacterota bacterium]
MQNIRNFCIIAHIDHGKSTLADRLLEITGTVEMRKMKEQYLDQLELERERGITIKMAPVRMIYQPTEIPNSKSEILNKLKIQNSNNLEFSNSDFVLNLIDTPGHPDFGYEVSRALEAVEGAILLVDGTQGIQAQTLSNYYAAKKAGLTVIGAVNKVDMAIPDIEASIKEVAQLLEVDPSQIHKISGKTGEGVKELLNDVIKRVPGPKRASETPDVNRALIFDSFYDDHKGIVAVVRVFNGSFKAFDEVQLIAANERIKIKEVGYFVPETKKSETINEGLVGYIVTGLKDPSIIKIGDTLISFKSQMTNSKYALPGYKEPKPVVFVSFYPDDPDEYDDLKKSLERLKLNDSSFTFDPDFNEVLGRGFKGGFLGKLHFEIISQRLEREFGVKTITSFPSVAYKMKTKSLLKEFHGILKADEKGYVMIANPKDLPDEYEELLEPMIEVEIICPHRLLGPVMNLKELFRWGDVDTQMLADKIIIKTIMPLAELVSDFDDRLKSVSGGFASFSYQEAGFKKHDLVRLDILVANELVPGLSRILPKENIEYEARKMASLLKETLPRQQFSQAIQAKVSGRIIARETIPAMKKDLGNFGKNGGDRTRKMKLWNKQKEGKKKLLSMAKVRISAQDFKKLLSK